MLIMIGKMSALTALNVLLTMLIWLRTREKELSPRKKVVIGIIYGLCSILATHYSVNYSQMLLNIRDLAPLSAGLFFDPFSGILAGLIGGIERLIAGTYWGIGSYTRFACSISTCLSGIVGALMSVFLFRGKKPSGIYAFFMGASMEVFHMYAVFITHRNDMEMAFYVVKICALPMIIFTGLGLAASSVSLQVLSGEWKNPFVRRKDEVTVSQRFQFWLFTVMTAVLLTNLQFAYFMQTQSSIQNARVTMTHAADDLREIFYRLEKTGKTIGSLREDKEGGETLNSFHVGISGTFELIGPDGLIVEGNHQGVQLTKEEISRVIGRPSGDFFEAKVFGIKTLCLVETLDNDLTLVVLLPMQEIYSSRDAASYENILSDILVFAVTFVLISLLVQKIVVMNLDLVNASLKRITQGDLNEVVNVRNSSEFASLSNDINQTVKALKGYIKAAEKRIEQELEFAREIQRSSLPGNFEFPRKDFEIYAIMDPAKTVGGDFYDFFFVDRDKLALVIADVSGKGIPAALFMMRAKTAIRGLAQGGRSPSEILSRANDTLCEGNEAEMFVTVWLGIINLKTGEMRCSNAGHEFPVLMKAGGSYELFKDRHGLVLAAMEGARYREYEIMLQPGDRIFVYTDGIPEAINKKVEQYGLDRLLTALNDLTQEDMKTTLSVVRQSISDFVGRAEQFDDITMLGLIYNGPDSAAPSTARLQTEEKE